MSVLPKPVLLRENTGMYGNFWEWIIMNTHVLKIYSFHQIYVNYNKLYNIKNPVSTLHRCKTLYELCNLNIPISAVSIPILKRGKTI